MFKPRELESSPDYDEVTGLTFFPVESLTLNIPSCNYLAYLFMLKSKYQMNRTNKGEKFCLIR